MNCSTLKRLVLSCVACLALAPQANAQQWITGPDGVDYTDIDRDQVKPMIELVDSGRHTVTSFFGAPFAAGLKVKIFPDRAALDSYWQKAWNLPQLKTECWMVASGVAAELDVLSPRVWDGQACEHSATDRLAMQRLITHELVHVYHAQNNADTQMAGLDDIAWFVEGLATYVSGQLDDERMARARAELAQMKTAPTLNQLWTGANRYGMAGSMVRYIDETFGRRTVIQMLGVSNQDDLLGQIDLEEDELVENWRRWMLKR